MTERKTRWQFRMYVIDVEISKAHENFGKFIVRICEHSFSNKSAKFYGLTSILHSSKLFKLMLISCCSTNSSTNQKRKKTTMMNCDSVTSDSTQRNSEENLKIFENWYCFLWWRKFYNAIYSNRISYTLCIAKET